MGVVCCAGQMQSERSGACERCDEACDSVKAFALTCIREHAVDLEYVVLNVREFAILMFPCDVADSGN